MSEQPEKRWVVAMADDASAAELSGGLSARAKVYRAATVREALWLVQNQMPGVLLTDLALPMGDGAALIARVRRLSLCTLPCAMALSFPGMELMAEAARRAGACRVIERPVTAEKLLAIAENLGLSDRLAREGADERRVEKMLWSLGFSAHMRGTRYLAVAAELLSRDVSLSCGLTSRLYAAVAGRFAVSQTRVEHAMRRAIDAAWSRGPREAQYRLFGNTIDAKRGKPTAGGMIARMAELLRTGMEIEA